MYVKSMPRVNQDAYNATHARASPRHTPIMMYTGEQPLMFACARAHIKREFAHNSPNQQHGVSTRPGGDFMYFAIVGTGEEESTA